jgi:hypothetical protein
MEDWAVDGEHGNSSDIYTDFNDAKRLLVQKLEEEMEMTEILFPPPVAEELQAIRQRITKDYDVRRAAMYLKLLRYDKSYYIVGKGFPKLRRRRRAINLFPLDKSYYMGLYFLYFNRHNIRKFVNILPVIFGR